MDFRGFESITKTDFPLDTACSMKTGGHARYAVFPENICDFEKLLCDGLPENTYICGNASNVLFPDNASGISVVFTTKMCEIRAEGENLFYADCGTRLMSLCNLAQKNALSGLEFAYGIPATVGGAVYMNASAYDSETANVIKEVYAFDIEKKKRVTISREDCRFSYRHSVFIENKNLIITGALFELSKGESDAIAEKQKDFMQRRRDKQPLEFPSCGSAFKRPEGHFAGKLIEDCSLKGFSVGGAQVSEKHAGFVINRGGAKSSDVAKLMDEVSRIVFEKFGIVLCPEIEIIKECQKRND